MIMPIITGVLPCPDPEDRFSKRSEASLNLNQQMDLPPLPPKRKGRKSIDIPADKVEVAKPGEISKPVETELPEIGAKLVPEKVELPVELEDARMGDKMETVVLEKMAVKSEKVVEKEGEPKIVVKKGLKDEKIEGPEVVAKTVKEETKTISVTETITEKSKQEKQLKVEEIPKTVVQPEVAEKVSKKIDPVVKETVSLTEDKKPEVLEKEVSRKDKSEEPEPIVKVEKEGAKTEKIEQAEPIPKAVVQDSKPVSVPEAISEKKLVKSEKTIEEVSVKQEKVAKLEVCEPDQAVLGPKEGPLKEEVSEITLKQEKQPQVETITEKVDKKVKLPEEPERVSQPETVVQETTKVSLPKDIVEEITIKQEKQPQVEEEKSEPVSPQVVKETEKVTQIEETPKNIPQTTEKPETKEPSVNPSPNVEEFQQPELISEKTSLETEKVKPETEKSPPKPETEQEKPYEVTTPTSMRRVQSQRISREERPYLVQVPYTDTSSDEEEQPKYTVEEPKEFDKSRARISSSPDVLQGKPKFTKVKEEREVITEMTDVLEPLTSTPTSPERPRAMFHIESDDEAQIDLESRHDSESSVEEFIEKVKREISENLDDVGRVGIFHDLSNDSLLKTKELVDERLRKISDTKPPEPEVEETPVQIGRFQIVPAPEPITEPEKLTEADVEEVIRELKLEGLEPGVYLVPDDQDKLEKRDKTLKRVERRFERMASETLEADKKEADIDGESNS